MIQRTIVTFLLAGVLLSADTLLLRNGSQVDGSFISGDNRAVRFAVGDHINSYSLSDVDSIRFASNSGGNQQGYSSSPAGAPPNSNYPSGQSNNSSYNGGGNVNSGAAYNAGPPNSSLQVPAGTEITVRLIDPVDSVTDRLGQTYRASLDQPVIVNGQTVIPRGADATATLIDTQKSGRLEGRTSLTLDLKTVTVNGRPYDITTTGVSQESSSRGARSAKVIGGTAAVGAIIGAIAGGGKGAAIGAGSGAAAGTAAQVITSGQKVKVPAETRLAFTLQNPINL